MADFYLIGFQVLGRAYMARNGSRCYAQSRVHVFHAGLKERTKKRTLKALLTGVWGITLASPALATGVHIPGAPTPPPALGFMLTVSAGVMRSIHIGLPGKLVHLIQSLGRMRGKGEAIIMAKGTDARNDGKTENELREFYLGLSAGHVCIRTLLLRHFCTRAELADLAAPEQCCSVCQPTIDEGPEPEEDDGGGVDNREEMNAEFAAGLLLGLRGRQSS
jgi:hypothetical protein